MSKVYFKKMKYRLTCSKCTLDHIHETDSMELLDSFWKNWNQRNGKNMKCVHEYVFKELE